MTKQDELFAALKDVIDDAGTADDSFDGYLDRYYADPAERAEAKSRLEKAEKISPQYISANKPTAIQALKEMLWDVCDTEECKTKRQQLFSQAGLFTDPKGWNPQRVTLEELKR